MAGRGSLGKNFKCSSCDKSVGKQDIGLCCDDCNLWYHAKCAGVDDAVYTYFSKGKHPWFCKNCEAGVAVKIQTVAALQKSLAEHSDLIKEMSKRIDALEQSMANPPAANNLLRDGSNLQTAIEEALLKERKKLNLVVVGLPEKNAIGDIIDCKEVIHSLADELNIPKSSIIDVFRHGREKENGKPRILKIKLNCSSDRRTLLTNYKKVATKNDITKRSFIRPDLTPTELEADRNLRQELFNRKQGGEMNIWIKRGKIISRNQN
jgi:hypothetical protein